jgi:hypothetical protein
MNKSSDITAFAGFRHQALVHGQHHFAAHLAGGQQQVSVADRTFGGVSPHDPIADRPGFDRWNTSSIDPHACWPARPPKCLSTASWLKVPAGPR